MGKSCYTCKHFRPANNLFNLFGLIETGDSLEFAKCDLADFRGTKKYTSVIRSDNWPERLHPCDIDGRAWESK